MICEKCGQWIDQGSSNCSKCGAPVGGGNGQNANAAANPGNAAANGAQPGGGYNAGAGAGQPGGYNSGAGAGQPGGYNAGAVPQAGYGMNPGPGGQAPMTKDQFYKHPNIAPVRSQIRSAGIICYVIAGINLVLSALAGSIFATILDILLIIGRGLGIQLGKSRVCAIILTVYGAFNMIIMTLQQGAISGWWILLAGIYATIYTFKYQSAWAEYLKTGLVKDFAAGKGRK